MKFRLSLLFAALLTFSTLIGGEYFTKIGLLNEKMAARTHTVFSDWKLLDVNKNEFVDRILKVKFPHAQIEICGADDIDGWYEFEAMDNETYITVERRIYGAFRWYYVGRNAEYKRYRRHE